MTPKEYRLDSGEIIKYDALHSRLRRSNGNATKCIKCDGKKAKRFEWALIKGRKYSLSINDYIQLCPSCHRHYDKCYGKIGDLVRGKKANNIVKVINCLGDEFNSITEASIITNISRTAISNNLAGLSKKAGGLIWKRV
jgi:hypothetical protein